MKKASVFALANVFSSGMVLQRERPLVFSGTAEPGKGIKLSFNNNTVSVCADKKGRWKAEFPAMKAGGPYQLDVTGAPEAPRLTLNDILIGDVWVCSGQSNMEMPMRGETPYWRTADADNELKKAYDPCLRVFNHNLRREFALDSPREDVRGPGWQNCTPETMESFSACAYYFGRKLRADLDVPIGLVSSNWGGSCIKSWISREKFEKEDCGKFLRFVDKSVEEAQRRSRSTKEPSWKPELRKWLKAFRAQADKTPYREALRKDYDDSAWKKNFFAITDVGIAVFRGEFVLPEKMAGKKLVIDLGVINDMDFSFLNGREIGATGMETDSYWGARRIYTIPAKQAVAGRNVIAVIAENHFSTGGFSPASPVKISLADDPAVFCTIENWKAKMFFKADLAKIGQRPAATVISADHNIPCALFNGMMNPWFRIAVKGVIWYQGCHNAGQIEYYLLHRWLIEDWRARWNDPSMPFLIVQLAGYYQHAPELRGPANVERSLEPPDNPSFPMAREIQAEMRNILPNVGLASAIDIGDEYDIHPRNKKDLGFRLACEAERIAYGKRIVSQGPEFDHMVKENAAIRVFFSHTEGGLLTKDGKAPGAFILKDRAGKLVWAEAKIEGDSVLVSSPGMTDPVHVRYAYAGYCGDANLVNGAGFPALPFRSDREDYSKCRFLNLYRS